VRTACGRASRQLRPQGAGDGHEPPLSQRGDGRFRDVSVASGIARVEKRYPMTAVAADLDSDGWVDIYVACDSTAAIFYHNNQDGTFTDVAMASGTALSEYGSEQPAWGSGSAISTATEAWTSSRPTSPTTSRRSIAASAGASTRRSRWRPVSACRTASCSGARGPPISTTTAGRTCSTRPATSTPRSSGDAGLSPPEPEDRLPQPR